MQTKIIDLASRRPPLPDLQGDAAHLPHHEPDAIEDANYEFRHGRASARLHAAEFHLPDRPFMPNFDGFGAPGADERVAGARRELRYRIIARRCLAVVLVLGVCVAGWSTWRWPGIKAHRTPATLRYALKQQGIDVRNCRADFAEGCLVCKHKLAGGLTVDMVHC